MAIFIVNSYTANLAAYLAGQSWVVSVKSVHDAEVSTSHTSGLSDAASNRARLTSNGTNLGLFKISFLFVLARGGARGAKTNRKLI